jgi:hypothetical protein
MLPTVENATRPTLAEWCGRNGAVAIPITNRREGFAVLVTVPDASYPERWRLWRLSDYRVTMVSGGTVYLYPIR